MPPVCGLLLQLPERPVYVPLTLLLLLLLLLLVLLLLLLLLLFYHTPPPHRLWLMAWPLCWMEVRFVYFVFN